MRTLLLALVVVALAGPLAPGSALAQSLPDADGDGVPNRDDKCPADPAETEDGCPAGLAEEERDMEEEPDEEECGGDACDMTDDDETEEGAEAPACDEEECAVETEEAPDDDVTYDRVQEEAKKYPYLNDEDGDGVVDAEDKCPMQRGPKPGGCPVVEAPVKPSPPAAVGGPSGPNAGNSPAPIGAEAPPTSGNAARIRRVADAIDGMAGSFESMIKAAEGASGCEELSDALSRWAIVEGERLKALMMVAYMEGLRPDEAKRPEVVAADKRFKAAMHRWPKIAVLGRCESDEAFQKGLDEDFIAAFGYLRGGAEEYTLEADDLVAAPLFHELVGYMEAFKAIIDGTRGCNERNRRLNEWWTTYGVRYETAIVKTYKTPFLDMDEDTCKAQREVYGDVVDRYDGLIYWLDEFEYTGCTEDGGSPVALSPAFEEGMDIPPHTRKWGYTPPTFKKRDSIW